ncbi:hypothetical protein ACQ86N_27655 [Puia sp. P3]|uniref:hypothetical protein n=1 Tax=Puia sp. P3 TaxID=3423952 RepID=UPI003D677D01
MTGATRDKISRKLDILVTRRGFRRILLLLEILHILSTSPDCRCITDEVYTPDNPTDAKDRLSEIYRYTQTNYHRDIFLKDIARIAGLTPQSFCRWFKKARTNISSTTSTKCASSTPAKCSYRFRRPRRRSRVQLRLQHRIQLQQTI